MKISTQIAVISLLIVIATNTVFKKEVNSADSKAQCLNGAQSFIYSQSQQIKSPSGIIIYFMPTPTPVFCGGASLSASLDRCVIAYDEVSTYWTSEMDISSGLLSDSTYDNWAKFIIPSCDGSLFQGFASNVTQYKGRNFTFRGNRIVKSNL